MTAPGFPVFGAEYLIGYERNAFASTGNVAEDILNITAVHPMRQEAVQSVLERTGADWDAIEELIDQDKLTETNCEGHTYYMRRTQRQRGR